MMGLFIPRDRKLHPKWIDLNSEEQLAALVDLSALRKTVIFKHSTRCGVSRMVLKHVEQSVIPENDSVDFYYLDLIKYRNISDAVSQLFKLEHESPQLIVVENGMPVKHATHYRILDLKF